ncbi:hypothetical protein [Streptomyces globisporus]|uniref:hypothetical protein n=1 Tax=Streptomyces globisporus TaxID=1908 RepID=UPI0004C7B33C|nr:hypothetical protein [Streptomyces globisporus]
MRLTDSLVVVKSVPGEVSASELVECEEYDEATAEIGPEVDLLGPRTRPRPPRRSYRVRAAGGRITGMVRIPPELVEEARRACRGAVAAVAVGKG